jgi:SAM-dependent methyltransferase
LDLGTGTGVLPRNLYRFGAKFIGVDISDNQIKEARKLSHSGGMDIEYIVASAENISFSKESFDVIMACQCFPYFDVSVVLPKIHNMLKDNGHFCILWMAWLPYEDKIAGNSENLVLKYNPSWTGAGEKRSEQSIPEWSKALFEANNSIIYDVNIPFTRESWHGRIKTCRGIGASSLSDETIIEFEKEHIKMLSEVSEPFDILHYVAILDLKKNKI